MPTALNPAYGHLFFAVLSGCLDDVLAARGQTRQSMLDAPKSEAMRITTGWLRDTPDGVQRTALAQRLFGARSLDVLSEMGMPRPSLAQRIVDWLMR